MVRSKRWGDGARSHAKTACHPYLISEWRFSHPYRPCARYSVTTGQQENDGLDDGLCTVGQRP